MINWLRDQLRKWLQIPIPAEGQLVESDEIVTPAGLRIPASLLNRTMQKAGEKTSFSRKVEPPKLPPQVVAGFVYSPSDDPAQLGAPVLAMDDAINAPSWAYLNENNCGMGFPGYGYLSELSQRSEYRSPVEVTASEMTREFIVITTKGKASQKKRKARGENVSEGANVDQGQEDKIEQLEAWCDKHQIRDKFRKLAEVDGFFGRAQLFIDVEPSRTGLDPDVVNQTPLILDPATIKKGSVRGFKVIEPIWTTPYSYNATDPTRGDFYKPAAWFVIGKRVHASRLLTFVSREVPDILKPAYNFGGLSLSQLMEPYVFQWLRTRNSVSDLVHNFSVMCLKTDMSAVLTAGNSSEGEAAGNNLLARAALFTQTRDNQGLMLMDLKREELVEVHASLSTLDKLQAQSQEHMAAPSHLPMVKLTGITPAGLNASSEGEISVWYDWVKAQQIKDFSKHLKHVLDIGQLDLFGAIDESIGFTFVSLNSPTIKELSEIRKSNGETDVAYITAGIISPDEARERVASDPDSGYNNLNGDAPEPPESGMMDKQHALGEESAQAGHERQKDLMKATPPKLAKDSQFREADHSRAENGEFTRGGNFGHTDRTVNKNRRIKDDNEPESFANS